MSTRQPNEEIASPVCQELRPAHASALATFFERLQTCGIGNYFHPHPLTAEEAPRRATYRGRDFYCVLLRGGQVIGYGMLRGWDEGYEVPSLGIVVDPAAQGQGHGRRLMELLHATARARGAKRIRLKVHPDNTRALALYRSLGYEFSGQEQGQLVGYFGVAPRIDSSKETLQ